MRKSRLLMLVGVAILLALLPRAAHGASTHALSNSQTFPDSIGEDPNAPDITSVAVANDDAGNITFNINVSNRPSFTADMYFLIFLNTDDNLATGDPDSYGADYVIQLEPGSVDLFQWNATANDYFGAASQTSLIYAYAATGPTIHVSQSDLGAPKVLDFVALAGSGVTTDAQGNPDFTNEQDDLAPDPGHGFYAYQVKTKVVLKQTAFTTAPAKAKAGKRFSASLAASESDTDGPVKKATISCKAVVAGKTLRATHSFAGGVSTCSWTLPKKGVKGKLIYGSMSIVVQGTKLTKSFTARIH
ncbi:MAG TPA: hypothetical protein VFW85_11605 [Gaiellaceae bacterium]|nr:hypothetical protein [Gaiellaceae bacterium]